MGVKGCLVVDENLFPVILMVAPLVKFAKREGGGILPWFSAGVHGATCVSVSLFVVLLNENEAPLFMLLCAECLPLKLEYAVSNCL